jgi:hypothetical protein
MSKQKLDGAQVLRPAVNQGRLRPPRRSAIRCTKYPTRVLCRFRDMMDN